MPSILDMLFGGMPQQGSNPLAGIFDSILGREAAGPSLPGMDPAARQPSSNAASPSMLDPQAMMRFSQGLVNAGGPSTMPTDLGSAFGQGMNNMQPQNRLRLPRLTLGGR